MILSPSSTGNLIFGLLISAKGVPETKKHMGYLPYGRNLAANSLFSGALTYSTGWNEESCAVKA
jgi:hypothetical protein